MIKRIMSGGQTGVDTGALLAANAIGLETGGWAPLGWLTETGAEEEFMRRLGLKECLRPGYPARTEMNVRDSDATLLIYSCKLSGGTYDTLCCAESMGKPVYGVQLEGNDLRCWTPSGSRVDFDLWLGIFDIKVLNVAGPRASKWAKGCEITVDWLLRQLT